MLSLPNPFRNDRTHVQTDTRSFSVQARERYERMEIQLQARCEHLRGIIERASTDLKDSEAVLDSIHAAQQCLDEKQPVKELEIGLTTDGLKIAELFASREERKNENV